MRINLKIALILILISIFSFSCKKEIIISSGYELDDWTTETHSSKATPDYAVVFPQDKVNRLDIVIENKYWQAMQDDLSQMFDVTQGMPKENPIYVPSQIFFNGKQWYDVGIRYKGNSSLSASYREGIKKLPLRLEFNHFEGENPRIIGQTFYGFQQLALANGFKDVSLVHEKIATDIYRDFGVPAPQTAFYQIYIDYGDGPVYFGLYTMVQVIFDKSMLQTQFGSNNGNCYKPEGAGATFKDPVLLTSDFFVNKTNTDQSLDDIISMAKALYSNKRTTEPAQWRANLEKRFNVNMFIRWLAANTTMQNWDTYGQMSHNFYLYNNPADSLLTWIPWDNNETFAYGGQYVLNFDFTNLDNSFPGPFGVTWPLIKYIYDDPAYRNIYNNYVNEFINGSFSPAKAGQKFTDAHNLISQYVTGSDGEIDGYTFLNSPDDFNNSLDVLLNFVTKRYNDANTYLNK